MKARKGPWVVALACALAGGVPAGAAAEEEAAGAAGCAWPHQEPGAHPLAGREEALARYRRLPERCLKAMVFACNAAAGRTMMDMGSAAQCSIGYEALLAQGFHGDFHALMAWWRSERDAGRAVQRR